MVVPESSSDAYEDHVFIWDKYPSSRRILVTIGFLLDTSPTKIASLKQQMLVRLSLCLI